MSADQQGASQECRCSWSGRKSSKFVVLGGVSHDLCMPVARLIDDAAHHLSLLQRIHDDGGVGHLRPHVQDDLARAIAKERKP